VKFWQLVSITNDDMRLISHVASLRPNWEKYILLVRDFDQLVQSQDRAALDSIVDADFSAAVLTNVKRDLYLSSDDWLRSWRFDHNDQLITILEAVTSYGADIVEDVYEKGSHKVTKG